MSIAIALTSSENLFPSILLAPGNRPGGFTA
jgi:hypothetical protein